MNNNGIIIKEIDKNIFDEPKPEEQIDRVVFKETEIEDDVDEEILDRIMNEEKV